MQVQIRYYASKLHCGNPWNWFAEMIFPDGEKITGSGKSNRRLKAQAISDAKAWMNHELVRRDFKPKFKV